MRAPSRLESFRILREQLVEAFISGDDITFSAITAQLAEMTKPAREEREKRVVENGKRNLNFQKRREANESEREA